MGYPSKPTTAMETMMPEIDKTAPDVHDAASRRYPHLLETITQILKSGPQQFTPKQSRMVADAVFAAIIQLLGQPGVTKLVTPIGVISLYDRPGYTGKHPKTGKNISVPDKTVVKFRPSTEMIRALARRMDTKVGADSLYRKVSE
jgi:nucleoid DNA-binding protein